MSKDTPKEILNFIEDIRIDGMRNAISNLESPRTFDDIDPVLAVMIRVYNNLMNNMALHLNDVYDAKLYAEDPE